MPMNTGRGVAPSTTDNPNDYEVDSVSFDGNSVVKFDSYSKQHYWISRVADNGQTAATSVILNPPIAGQSDLQFALQSLTAVRGGESKLITQADLSVAAVVAIIPTTTGIYRDIEVYNNEGELISPDTIIATASGIAIGLETYVPIIGTYKILYRIEQI
jgi:hypothetical protein